MREEIQAVREARNKLRPGSCSSSHHSLTATTSSVDVEQNSTTSSVGEPSGGDPSGRGEPSGGEQSGGDPSGGEQSGEEASRRGRELGEQGDS